VPRVFRFLSVVLGALGGKERNHERGDGKRLTGTSVPVVMKGLREAEGQP